MFSVAQILCRPEPPTLEKAQRAFYVRPFLGRVISAQVGYHYPGKPAYRRQVGNSWGRTFTCKICSF